MHWPHAFPFLCMFLSPCQGFLISVCQTQITRPLGWIHTGPLAFYRTLHSLVTSLMLKQIMPDLCTEDWGNGTTINMPRMKSGTVVIIRSEAGKCNYFFTEQRQMESSWLCNRRQGSQGLECSICKPAYIQHPHITSYIFFPLHHSFSLFSRNSIKLVTVFSPSHTSFFA